MIMNWIRIVTFILLAGSSPLQAQDADSWNWKIAPYLWGINMSGDVSIGPIKQDVDVSFSDILSNMELAGQVYAEFGKSDHSVHFDYTYLRLRPEPSTLPSPPFLPGAELSTKLTVNIFETAYNYYWKGPGGPALVLGARMTDMKTRMNPGRLETRVSGPDWWDYFVGIKTHNPISRNWDFDFYGTVGTGGSDLPWTLAATFGRRFASNNRLLLGFRLWGVDYSQNNSTAPVALDLKYYGAVIGYEFN